MWGLGLAPLLEDNLALRPLDMGVFGVVPVDNLDPPDKGVLGMAPAAATILGLAPLVVGFFGMAPVDTDTFGLPSLVGSIDGW